MIISSKIEEKINNLNISEDFRQLMRTLLVNAPYSGKKSRYTDFYQKEVQKYLDAQKEIDQ